MNLASILDIVRPALAFVAAGLIAYTMYGLVYWLSSRITPNKRVSQLMGSEDETKQVAVKFGSEKHRLQLAFGMIGLNVAGWETAALMIARIVGVVVSFLAIHYVIGLPLFPALLGGFAGIFLVNGFVSGAWTKARAELEAEIPGFLSSFTSTIQVTQDVLLAMEEELAVLKPDGYLRAWMEEFLRDARQRGTGVLAEKQEEAAGISSSLTVLLFLIEGLWRSGGPEWKTSFALAGSNLENVLEARIAAHAVGESARSNIMVVAGTTLVVMVMVLRNPSFADALANPIVQLVYAAIFGAMMLGWNMMSQMIEESV